MKSLLLSDFQQISLLGFSSGQVWHDLLQVHCNCISALTSGVSDWTWIYGLLLFAVGVNDSIDHIVQPAPLWSLLLCGLAAVWAKLAPIRFDPCCAFCLDVRQHIFLSTFFCSHPIKPSLSWVLLTKENKLSHGSSFDIISSSCCWLYSHQWMEPLSVIVLPVSSCLDVVKVFLPFFLITRMCFFSPSIFPDSCFPFTHDQKIPKLRKGVKRLRG